MSIRKIKLRRPFPKLALPADLNRDGFVWLKPPSAVELQRRYAELTKRMDAERAVRAVAIKLLMVAERTKT